MFSALFDLDNPVLKFLSRLVDLIVLNVIFVISCIPIVTIGAALTSLYYVCITDWDPQNAQLFKRYTKSFKENLKQSTILWLILLAAGIIMGGDVWFSFVQWQNTGIEAYRIWIVICIIGFIVYLCIFTYVWPLQAKFENTIKKTLQNALIMAVGHLPETVVAWCIAGVVGYCVYEYLVMKAMLFVLVFSVVAYLQSILFRSVFQPYLDEGKRKEAEKWKDEPGTSYDNRYADAKLEAAKMAEAMKEEEEEETSNPEQGEEV